MTAASSRSWVGNHEPQPVPLTRSPAPPATPARPHPPAEVGGPALCRKLLSLGAQSFHSFLHSPASLKRPSFSGCKTKIPEGAGGFSPLKESEFAGPSGPGFCPYFYERRQIGPVKPPLTPLPSRICKQLQQNQEFRTKPSLRPIENKELSHRDGVGVGRVPKCVTNVATSCRTAANAARPPSAAIPIATSTPACTASPRPRPAPRKNPSSSLSWKTAAPSSSPSPRFSTPWAPRSSTRAVPASFSTPSRSPPKMSNATWTSSPSQRCTPSPGPPLAMSWARKPPPARIRSNVPPATLLTAARTTSPKKKTMRKTDHTERLHLK